MPPRRSEGEGKEREQNEAVPCSILSYALRNAICRVSPGATVVASKSELISETVQNAQRKKSYNELEEKRKIYVQREKTRVVMEEGDIENVVQRGGE